MQRIESTAAGHIGRTLAAWAALGLWAAAPAAEEPWQPLFNERDLSGWEVAEGNPQAWKAEDGILVCGGGGGGWLSTTREYGDFELELEFRVPKGGNSGVFLRAPREGNPAFAGMEIQVLDDGAALYRNLKPAQYTGSIYDVVAASPRATKPAGQWQTMRIRCHDRQVQVWVNGTQVVDANLDEHLARADEHPGLKRSRGYLGLQNHGSRLEYRKLRIREL